MEPEKCSMCGLCKVNCPIYKSEMKESASPRAKAMMIRKGLKDDKIFYACTLCKSCVVECPAGVDMDLRKVRSELVKAGHETEANRKMMENIRKYGNPFGEPKDGKPKELYCC
jgi:Fe-S oxidoreductase